MKVGCTEEHNPAQVDLYHKLLAMQYPDASLPLGLLVDILCYFRLQEVGAVGVMLSTLTRDPAIAERRRNLSM